MNTNNMFSNVKAIIKPLLWGGLVGLFTSCLNLEPKDSLSDNTVWDTAENFQLFANQFYGYSRDFQGADYLSGLSDGVHSDYRSDLCCTSTRNAYSDGTNPIPATDGNYTKIYTNLYNCNLLLEKAKDFPDSTAIKTAKGEALWFRAYLNFELVQIYGDAILLTEPLDIESTQLYAKRNSRTEIIDQCLRDLDQATKYLPSDATFDGTLNRFAAWALQSRIALYEGTWQKFHTNGADTKENTALSTKYLQKAKDAAWEVIKCKKYSLFYNKSLTTTISNEGIGAGNQSYRYMFILEDGVQCNPAKLTKSDNKEYIFAHRHRSGDKLGLNITHAMAGNACWVTSKMADMYLCQDGLPIDKSPLYNNNTKVAEFVSRDARMDNTMLFNGEKYWDNDGKWRTKWTDADESSCETAETGKGSNSGYLTQKWAVERQVADYYESMDYPVIRFAEIELNYVEATYELKGHIDDPDLDYLNDVRHRVNKTMPGLTNEFVRNNSLDMREEIRRERTVELFLEGFRIDDLKRWKTAETEMPQTLTGVMKVGEYANWNDRGTYNGRVLLWNSRQWEQKNYLYPLPSDQTQLNPNLGQNPGWK